MNIDHPRGIVLILFTLLVAGCQTPAQPDRFAKVDTDRSGELSLDEINHYLVDEIFSSRDQNKDGKLTREEWKTGSDSGQEKAFRARDKNGDGVVTKEEALAYGRRQGLAEQLVRQADTNKDGKLTRAEVTAYYASREGPPR